MHYYGVISRNKKLKHGNSNSSGAEKQPFGCLEPASGENEKLLLPAAIGRAVLGELGFI